MNIISDYDSIAENIFAPLYPLYAQRIIERTGVASGRLLDIGCGGGHLGLAMLALGSFESAAFVDINAQALEQTRDRATSKQLQMPCSFVKANVCTLPFEDGCFDLIVSRGSIPFWKDRESALRELYRVLAINGYAYIGGGLGNRELREQILSHMQQQNIEPPHGGKSTHNKSFSDENSIALLRKLDCSYTIINSHDEGHWLIFKKDEQANKRDLLPI